MRKVQLLFFICLIQLYAFGHSVGFYVKDSITHLPIENVTIRIVSTDQVYSSDINGYVRISLTSDENTCIQFFSIGYRMKMMNVNESSLNNNDIIYLTPKVSSMSEVKVFSKLNSSIFNQLNQLDINYRPITNSQDVLRMVPGLFIGQHAGGGKAEQIFLRGFDLDHGTDINISVDGMPVNMVSHAHGQGYADLHFVIPEFIQQVQFEKGPYQASKGNFTTAGYVAFETKTFLNKNFIKLEGGQFDTYRLVMGLNLLPQKQEKINRSLIFGSECFYSNGYFEHAQHFDRFNAFIKFHQELNKKHTISAVISGFTSKWNASGQIPDRAVASGLIGFYGTLDSTEGGQTSRYNAQLTLLSHLRNSAHLKQQLFLTNNTFELYSNFTFFKMDSVHGDQIKQAEYRNILGYSATLDLNHRFKRKDVFTTAGIQMRSDVNKNLELAHTMNRSTILNELMYGNVLESNAGIFVQEKVHLSNHFTINYGLRYDLFSNAYDDKIAKERKQVQLGVFSPKLNFSYQLKEGLQIYLNTGKGFHSNDSRVVVQKKGNQVIPPAYGSDLGLFYKLNSKIMVQMALWYLWMGQEFIYVGDEGVIEQGGKTKRLGVDCSVRYEFIENFFFDMDLNYSKPRFTGVPDSQKFIPLAPIFTSIGGITMKRPNGINGSLRYRYMSDRPANETYSMVAKGYFILDATLKYTRNNYEFGLNIQNVMNKKWKETQFDTESKLQNENKPVSEIHFTAGTPFNLRLNVTWFF